MELALTISGNVRVSLSIDHNYGVQVLTSNLSTLCVTEGLSVLGEEVVIIVELIE